MTNVKKERIIKYTNFLEDVAKHKIILTKDLYKLMKEHKVNNSLIKALIDLGYVSKINRFESKVLLQKPMPIHGKSLLDRIADLRIISNSKSNKSLTPRKKKQKKINKTFSIFWGLLKIDWL